MRTTLLWSAPEPVLAPAAARRRLVTAWDLGAVVLANAVVVCALWWRYGGLDDLGGAADTLSSLGRLTGLLGAYSALVQLLLLARVPALERAYGFERLAVLHRINGKACLYLIVAHTVLITAGYTIGDRVSLWSEIDRLITRYPGVLPATVGLVMLIAVAVTSYVFARRRLRYETWYFIHLYAYLGVALAFSHQLATGTEFVGNPVARAYWYALYLVTLGALVSYRLALPAFRAVFHALRVQSVTPEGPGVVSLRLSGRRLDRLGARPGQFFLWRFLTRDRWWEAHPFSVSALPDRGTLRITVKALGDFTSRIGAIAPGTRVIADGPFGACTSAARRTERVLFIAGGVGITAIRPLLEEASGDIVVLYRVARDEDVVFRDELERVAEARGAALHYVVGDHREVDLLGVDHLRALVPDIAARDVYVCGPAGMVDATEASVRAAGVPRGQIHLERYAL